MQGNTVQFVYCECGLLYMLDGQRDSAHVIHCPACGRTPRIEHVDRSIPSNFPQRLASLWQEYVVSGVLPIATLISLMILLPTILSQQAQPPTGTAPLQSALEPSSSGSSISLH